MKHIRNISNIKFLIGIIALSLFLTNVPCVSNAEGVSAMPDLAHIQSDGSVVNFAHHPRVGRELTNNTTSEYVEGEVLVVLGAPAASDYSVMGAFSTSAYSQVLTNQAEAFAREFWLEALNTYSEIASVSGSNIVHFRSEHKSTEELIQELSYVPGVVSVYPNYITKLDPSVTKTSTEYHSSNNGRIPNDPFYSQLWGMENIGIPKVWEHVTGSDTIIVAVLDTGIDYYHPDLKDNMARDSYGNYGGYFFRGIQLSDPIDLNGHGTHVAGTIGAVGNNGIGVVGVNWNVKMLAVNILVDNWTEDSDIIAGMNYVLSEKNRGLNIRVANMSFGRSGDPEPDNSPMGTAVKSLSDAGIICVMAAGNNNRDLNTSSISNYPACFRFENTITVGAIEVGDVRSYFSNYGNQWVDIAAPGSYVYSTYLQHINNGYETLSGTSMAAPHVAGVAALLCAAFPDESASQIKARILSKARNIGVSNGLWANGTLNAAGAYGAPGIVTPFLQEGAIGVPYSHNLRANGIVPITWSIDSSSLPSGLALNGFTGEIHGTPTTAGTYNFMVKAENSEGADTKPLSIVITTVPVVPTINTLSLPNGTIDAFYRQFLNASGTAPITWSIDSGSLPSGLTLNGATGEISGTPTISGMFNFTVRAANTVGSITRTLSIFIPAPVYVTGVTLNKNNMSLHVANYEHLTATLFPADASNKRVTWNSSHPNIASVNEYGLVTGISGGTTTITVTTVQGGFSDTCEVIVSAHPFHSGSGTPTDPFIITTPAELDSIRIIPGAHYKLQNDIDLSEYLSSGGTGYAKWGNAGWLPIGSHAIPFTGSINGNGYKISGLRINGSMYAGLFGHTFGVNSTIKNLGVEIDDFRHSGVSGGLVGYSWSNIENCYVIGDITLNWVQIGGLVGWQEWGNITNCYTTGNINGTQSIGGLVGHQNNGTIFDSYAIGDVSASSNYSSVGGLVGSSGGNISSSYATGNVIGDIGAGGLVGQGNTILNCYATGNVIGNERVGGLAGGSSSNITNSYATGNVSGNSRVGGLAGVQDFIGSPAATINSYATGNVSGSEWVGGLVGMPGNSITNSYRYQFATVNGAVVLSSDSDSAPDRKHGGVVTASELMSKSTYENNDWMFNDSTIVGPWHWDNRNFPKLNIGTENFPFGFTPGVPVVYIITQPVNASVTQGTITDSLSVIADMVPSGTLNYQWYVSMTNSNTGGTLIGGATNSNFIIPSNLTPGVYYYYCVISSDGAVSVHSRVASVVVFSGGNGTAADPFIITTAAVLDAMRENSSAHYKLGNDIDLADYLAPNGVGYAKWSEAGWEPVGNPYISFTGSFDGNGHVISGLWINRSNTDYVGLFGYTGGAVFKNLCVETATAGVGGRGYVGGLVGLLSQGSITNCRTTGNINGIYFIGGLVGVQNFGTISNCYTTCNISGYNDIGGLVGWQNDGNIANCYSTGTIYGFESVGGLAGFQRGSITNSYAIGNIIGNVDIGGLVGHKIGSIINSYRYKFLTINGMQIPDNDSESVPDGRHGGVKTAVELMTQTTYSNNNWQFTPSGPWHWGNKNFPKLNIGKEDFPFNFTPGIYVIVQPEDITVVQGSIIGSLSVSAVLIPSGTLTYQWYSNTIKNNSGGTVIPGATNSSFTIPTTLTEGIHYYYCVISAPGVTDVPSNAATVTVTDQFVQVTDIIDLPEKATIKNPTTLTGTVVPNNATYKSITWSVQNAGGTGATIIGNTLYTILPGTAVVMATIENGTAVGTPFVKSFNITVNHPEVSTFTQLQAAINNLPESGQTDIVVANDISFDSQVAIHSSNNITIKSSGNNNFILSPTSEGYRHFIVNSGASLTLENITLDGGYSGTGSYRGGIENRGELTLNTGAVIQKCYAFSGGGIDNSGTLKIMDGKIIDNTANNSGGGIYNLGTIEIINSEISGNFASWSSGGINNRGTLEVSGSRINNNSVTVGGGGITNEGGLVIVNNSEISNNSAGYGGGVYNFYNGTLRISGSKIIGNSVISNGGGGISNEGGIVIVNDSEISGNTAYSFDGGGIRNGGSNTTAIIDGCKIIGNTANRFGGGIYNLGTIEIINSEISGNTSNQGGGIYSDLENATVSDTIFSRNTASQAYWMIDAADIAMYNSQITGVTQFSAPPEGNKPFEYAYNNYDISYTKGLTVNPITVPVTGVTIEPKSITILTGETRTLTATISPNNATYKNVTWSSSNPAVATVNISGDVTGIFEGTSTITVITHDQNMTDTCEVTVKNPFVPVTDIVDVQKITTAGTPLTLTGTVVPNNATNKAISWSVQNAGGTGATITDNTLYTTSHGTAIVRATILNGTSIGVNYTKDFDITVNAAGIPPKIITTSLPSGTVGTFYSQTLSVTGTTPITWSLESGSLPLPNGLSLSSSGLISGTPTTAGLFNFMIRAENSSGSDMSPLSITINDIHESSRLYLSPSIITAGKDRNFTFTFRVDSPQLYNIAECILTYDPDYLELQEVKPVLPPLWYFFSNTEERNKVSVGVGNLSGAVLSGDDAIAMLTFKALAETPGTNISMIVHPGYGPGSSKLVHQGNLIDFTGYGSTITISNTTTLKASFLGRPNSNPDSMIEKLMIIWTSGGAFIASELVTTDRNGEAEIVIPLQNSDLTIWVKGESTLATSKYIGTVTAGSTIDVGTLNAGDANGDNSVDMGDFFIFASNYGRSWQNDEFNRLADFNNDRTIDMMDFYLFASNYGKTGTRRPEESSMTTLSSLEYINEKLSSSETYESGSEAGCNAIPVGVVVLFVFAIFILLRFRT